MNSLKKSYKRMQNDVNDVAQDAQPQQQGRLRLGGRRKKIVAEIDNSSSYNGGFPSEFSSVYNFEQHRHFQADAATVTSKIGEESIVSHGETTDVAIRPTISKPALCKQQHYLDQMSDRFANGKGSATIVSTTSFESIDRVEKPSITSPCIHNQQWNRNRMSKHRMLSEKTINTINTINTQGTMNTNATAGTGMQTVTTADSTFRSSIASIQSFNNSMMLGSSSDLGFLSAGSSNLPSSSPRRWDSHEGSMSLRHVTLHTNKSARASQVSVGDAAVSQNEGSPDANETEEDRMMRLAMEMSLRDFEDSQKQELQDASSHKRQVMLSPDSALPSRPSRIEQRSHEAVTLSTTAQDEQFEQDLSCRLHSFYRQSSQQSLLTTATKEDQTEVLVENRVGIQRNRRSSRMLASSPPPQNANAISNSADGMRSIINSDPSIARQLDFARAHLSKEEADEIERALLEEAINTSTTSGSQTTHASYRESLAHHQQLSSAHHLSLSEAAEIEKAIREADIAEQKRFLSIAMQETVTETAASNRPTQSLANAAAGFADEHEGNRHASVAEQDRGRNRATVADESLDRCTGEHEWSEETDERALGIEADEDIAFVGNTAYNGFKQSCPVHPCQKNPDEVHSSDERVHSNIANGVSSGLITQCNGVVKEGKEASVYHAEQGTESDGHDVAIKVFRRLKDSKIRSLMGDPRYFPRSSRSSLSCTHEELIIRAEREHRNLVRANRARVPVASPLLQQENLVFMRFMGEDGWPAPQLKELELRKGSPTWCLLYSQIMVAVRRLYISARLVHADLNEYNVLVCPADMVENKDESTDMVADSEKYQAVLIDFVQAVDVNHPQADELLDRDLEQIRSFFSRKGIKTLGRKMAIEFVTAPDSDAQHTVKTSDTGDERRNMFAADVDSRKHGVEEVSGADVIRATSINTSKSDLECGSKSTALSVDPASRLGPKKLDSQSTKSSFSSLSSAAYSHGLKQSSDTVAQDTPTSNAVAENATELSRSDKVAKKEKKEKKSHKEKKEKKKKKEKKESSTSKRKTQDLINSLSEPENVMLEQTLFPIPDVSSPSFLKDSFDEFKGFEEDQFDWEAEWGDDIVE